MFKLLTTAADGSFAVWDMRPPPQKASMTGLKKRGQKEQEQKETDPYAHLNLFWKPILKANLQNGDSGVHNPTKISLPKFNGETIKEFLTFFLDLGGLFPITCLNPILFPKRPFVKNYRE